MKATETGTVMEKRWAFPLVISSLICVILLATSFNMGIFSSLQAFHTIFWKSISTANQRVPLFVDFNTSQTPSPPSAPSLPRFAYLVSGSKGDLDKLWRTLHSLYHPRNQYIVHLDLESSVEERLELASRVEKDPMFVNIGNVHMITKANMVTYRGPTMVSNTLHACAILLRRSKDWDWFINLSASDYPLVTQDDLIHTFSSLDRNLNFIEHTSNLGWKAERRGMPLIVDPGLFSTKKADIFPVQPKRQLPNSFKLFTGSAWMILSRPFVEYLIWGWDNLPRTLLMYYANFVSSPEHYFHTVICNAPEFKTTAINHDMHFISWNNPPKQHPRTLNIRDVPGMLSSNAPFARKFGKNDPALDKIDKDLLHRANGSFTPGAWCDGKPLCSLVGNADNVKPGPGATRLSQLVSRIVLSEASKRDRCR